ncbi:GntR family transcriptional regulator [Extibacter muris]|uniref:GntR family transcriptional regulator n=2 Tax=Extibacter muris TaxID=1796622 RepID=UPI001D087DE4|nr:GntR family transcriptional regulator [Extibacter muris]MCB6200682.1 GntR family transcriptional regulator [Extibacter muris]MCQ4665633.1 GntR family transcriptional regulator [Extibacter muris]MCQ4695345.1 GntR family transcriptional regulator [Extibacter muris]
MMKLKQIGNKKSLTEQAYEVLKEAIISGEFQQGQILTEEQLANELAISRTPVRAAVKQLEFENLVEVNPSRNIIVATITEKDIEDAVQARSLVEVEVAGMLAETATKEQCEQLRKIVSRQMEAVKANDYLSFLEHECEFHSKIGEYCGNVWYEKLLRSISILQRRVLTLAGHLEDDWEFAAGEHSEIVNYLEQHQKEEVRTLMNKHIRNGQPAYLFNKKEGHF